MKLKNSAYGDDVLTLTWRDLVALVLRRELRISALRVLLATD